MNLGLKFSIIFTVFYLLLFSLSSFEGTDDLTQIGQTTRDASGVIGDIQAAVIQPSQRFIDNDNGTVTDNFTGIMWQKGEGGAMDWQSAISYCKRFAISGYTDWRLPNVEELESIADDTRNNPAINTNYFPDAHPSEYWSSSTYPLDDRYAWIVYFSHPFLDNHHKSNNYHVRCVRGIH